MNEQFQGVTFAQQNFRPADDAIVRRAIFPDCILVGCALDILDKNVSMGPGYLMICGREICHKVAQSWPVDANAGAAQLVITVDLMRTSGKEVAHNISAALTYAEDVDSFPDLNRDDINSSGLRYQASICTVSIGPDGTLEMSDQIERMEVTS